MTEVIKGGTNGYSEEVGAEHLQDKDLKTIVEVAEVVVDWD